RKKPKRRRNRPRAAAKSSPRPATARCTRCSATSRRRKRSKKTRAWSKKTPNRPAATTSKPSRTSPTWSSSAAIPAPLRRRREGRANRDRGEKTPAPVAQGRADAGGERRAAHPARPAAGEVHDHADGPRRRLLRDGDPRPRADGRAHPQGG